MAANAKSICDETAHTFYVVAIMNSIARKEKNGQKYTQIHTHTRLTPGIGRLFDS